MAKFINTSATNYFLEELIKEAREKLIIISPFLKFNDRIRELLEDKDRLKIDVRLVYGKSELAPAEINWLQSLTFIRTSFCKNLHAKCYLNERVAIITSMNLYDFSQINNNEMGVLIDRDVEDELYRETHDEVQRLIRVSDEVRLSAQKVDRAEQLGNGNVMAPTATKGGPYEKLTTSKLAKALGIPTAQLNERLLERGLLVRDGSNFKLTPQGEAAGGEFRFSKKYGPYFLWPEKVEL